MMEHLTAVREETENDLTATDAPKQGVQDEFGLGEKIRVDRRKLEQMLRENGDESGLTANEFFNEIMKETETVISWPMKLKIGAKSKKDPHIKIAGLPENIKKAKDLVAVKLESKANRVSLKMDVSHTDHSHIIGRRGQNINKIMDETNCHIHFPDSNRGSASAEKSNQVSITGQPEGVEKARARIREMLPLVLCFEIKNYNDMFLPLPLDLMEPPIQYIAQGFDVTFTTKGRTQFGCLVSVRGNQDRVGKMQEAMAALSKHLTGSSELPNVVQLHLDVAPQHHVFLVGRSACNIRDIMEQTAAKIELPDARVNARHGMITLTGSIHAVIRARTLLVNCLPLLLMFDLKEEEARHLQDQPDNVKRIMDKFGVTISIKPKPKQSSKSVTIKSKESNAQNMYLTRLEILGNPMDPYTLQHPTPIPLHFNQQGIPWYANIQTSPYASPLHSPTPRSMRSDSPVSFVRQAYTPPPYSRAPPGLIRPPSRSDSFNSDYHPRSRSAEPDISTVVRGAVSEGGSPNQSFDFVTPRRHSEPTPYADVWKASKTGMANQSKASGPSPPSLVPISRQRITMLAGTKNAQFHGLLDSHGSNPASSFDSLGSISFSRVMDAAPQNKFVNYEEKRGMSTELMTRKVAENEVRIPTDQWSGLHLSKSVDFDALKKEQGKVEEEETDSSEPSPKEVKKLELNRAVMRDPSASMRAFPRERKYESPFSQPCNNNRPSVNHLSGGNFEELKKVLDVYGLLEYIERFKSLEIDNLDVFLSLTKDDLIEAGFTPLGTRKKIENAIEAMKKVKHIAIEKDMAYKAQSFHASNPLDFNHRSGRF